MISHWTVFLFYILYLFITGPLAFPFRSVFLELSRGERNSNFQNAIASPVIPKLVLIFFPWNFGKINVFRSFRIFSVPFAPISTVPKFLVKWKALVSFIFLQVVPHCQRDIYHHKFVLNYYLSDENSNHLICAVTHKMSIFLKFNSVWHCPMAFSDYMSTVTHGWNMFSFRKCR